MTISKIDVECNRILESRLDSEFKILGQYDLPPNDRFFIFSNSDQAAIWVSPSLLSEGFERKPRIRVKATKLPRGYDFSIFPLCSRVKGTIYLITELGAYTYSISLNKS